MFFQLRPLKIQSLHKIISFGPLCRGVAKNGFFIEPKKKKYQVLARIVELLGKTISDLFHFQLNTCDVIIIDLAVIRVTKCSYQLTINLVSLKCHISKGGNSLISNRISSLKPFWNQNVNHFRGINFSAKRLEKLSAGMWQIIKYCKWNKIHVCGKHASF